MLALGALAFRAGLWTPVVGPIAWLAIVGAVLSKRAPAASDPSVDDELVNARRAVARRRARRSVDSVPADLRELRAASRALRSRMRARLGWQRSVRGGAVPPDRARRRPLSRRRETARAYDPIGTHARTRIDALDDGPLRIARAHRPRRDGVRLPGARSEDQPDRRAQSRGPCSRSRSGRPRRSAQELSPRSGDRGASSAIRTSSRSTTSARRTGSRTSRWNTYAAAT